MEYNDIYEFDSEYNNEVKGEVPMDDYNIEDHYFPYGYEIKSGTIKFYIKKDTFIDLVKSECSLDSVQMAKLLNTNPDTNKNSIWNKCLVKLVNDYFCIKTLNLYFDFDYSKKCPKGTLCNLTGLEYKEESEFNSFLNDEVIIDGDVNIDCPIIFKGIDEFFDGCLEDDRIEYGKMLRYEDEIDKYKFRDYDNRYK